MVKLETARMYKRNDGETWNGARAAVANDQRRNGEQQQITVATIERRSFKTRYQDIFINFQQCFLSSYVSTTKPKTNHRGRETLVITLHHIVFIDLIWRHMSRRITTCFEIWAKVSLIDISCIREHTYVLLFVWKFYWNCRKGSSLSDASMDHVNKISIRYLYYH